MCGACLCVLVCACVLTLWSLGQVSSLLFLTLFICVCVNEYVLV